MNIIKLLTPNYLFDAVPGLNFAYAWPLYIFFGLVIGLSFYVKSYLKNRPNHKLESRFFGNIPSRMREFGILGLFVTFLRDQNIPYLGMRAWIMIVLLGMLAYAIYIARNYKKNISLAIALTNKKTVEDKYVPKAKKKLKRA